MADGPPATAPRLQHENLINIGLAVAGAAITHLVLGEWFYGWLGGLLVGVLGGRALARRRPDLADPRPAQPAQTWQRVLVAILVVAVVVALVVALSN